MSHPHPHTQSELAENLERWYGARAAKVKLRGGDTLADWEKDKIFMVLAFNLWPVDMEAAKDPHYQSTARMRLRLRWEGFRGAADASERLTTMLATADYVREQLRR